MRSVALFVTMETKSDEAVFFVEALDRFGVRTEIIDISLGSKGENWSSQVKINKISEIVKSNLDLIRKDFDSRFSVAVGLGGGTGSDIILKLFKCMPMTFSKVLITTLPFDPRAYISDNSIFLIPSLSDIESLNAALRETLIKAAAMISGLANVSSSTSDKSVGLSTLGITKAAGDFIAKKLRKMKKEVTIFHANGFGGGALSRFARDGLLSGVIEMTVHEKTRMVIDGVHSLDQERYQTAGHLPRVVLPGGLNFIGLGARETLPDKYLKRRFYQHSSLFTHVKLEPDEMEYAVKSLCEDLNKSSSETIVIVPMGGFSSEDCEGGSIEDPKLRCIAADTFEALAQNYTVVRIDDHINSISVANLVVKQFLIASGEEGLGEYV